MEGDGKNESRKTSQQVAIQSAAYALVKYASQKIPDFDFSVCTKIFKGGVVRVWVEKGRNIPENFHKETLGDPVEE